MRFAPLSPIFAPVIAAGLCAGCAGGTLGRIGGGSELPKELPKEMVERFTVKDAPKTEATAVPIAYPSPAPSVIPKTSKKTTKKTKKVKGVEPVLPAQPEVVTYPNRRPAKDPIWQGERATYSITYFGMEAGLFTLEVLPYKAINDRKVYHIRGTAESSKIFNLFYRINDSVETFIDYEGFFSHRFHLVLDESKQSRDALELNDSIKQQTYYWNRWKHVEKDYVETKEFKPIPIRFPQDSLSALYYLRTVPLPTGKVFTFPVLSEGNMWEAVITVVRREIVSTPLGRIQCVVLQPDTKYRGVLKKNGESFIWLTDDDRRHLVRLEAKVKIGTVVADLKKVEPGTPP